jgi:hypothetical protein
MLTFWAADLTPPRGIDFAEGRRLSGQTLHPMRHGVRMISLPARFAAALTALGGVAPAAAHGLEANHVQIVVHERTAEVVATAPSEFVAAADANHDGLLDVDEVRAHRGEIIAALVAALSVTDGEGRAGALDRADVSVPRADDARGSDYLRLTVVLRWPAPPSALRVRCGFVTGHPMVLYATHAESVSQPGVLTLVGDGEYGTLASAATEVTVLRARSVAPPVAAPRPAPRRPPPVRTAVTAAAAGAVAALVGALALRLRRRSRNVPIGDPT